MSGALAPAIYRCTVTPYTINQNRCSVLDAAKRYWPRGKEIVHSLPIPLSEPAYPETLPPRVAFVSLPEWAYDLGVDKAILVPDCCIIAGPGDTWMRTDWLGTMFWYMQGLAEQAFENRYGPIHAYAFRLKRWNEQLWEHAWVNRIALFLRRWAAVRQGVDEDLLFGLLPEPEIILTHDIDTITKTGAIRLKQSAFHFFNTIRNLFYGHLRTSLKKLVTACKFLLSTDDYWCFDQILTLEKQHGIRSHFNIYGGKGGWLRMPSQLLFDPSYNVVQNARLTRQLQMLHEEGWTIGLHPSFASWSDKRLIITERQNLEQALGFSVTTCRQHWLRFSWQHTWKAQQQAGLMLDTTLGFNDRPGFRNGAALHFHPWDEDEGRVMQLSALPMVLMDSHLYDYTQLSEKERIRQMQYWIDEICTVRGTATLLWHGHVMSRDYGWGGGYETLLNLVKKRVKKTHDTHKTLH